MLSPRLRFSSHSSGPTALAAALASACVLTTLASGLAPAFAQGWDPFSQLETNRWERRSKTPVQKSETARRDAAVPGSAPPPDGYIDTRDSQPRFAEPTQQTYYPRPSNGPPAYERSAPYGTSGSFSPSGAPSTVSAEPLAPLPTAPPPATEPGPSPVPSYAAPYSGPNGTAQDLAVRRQDTPRIAMTAHGSALPHELWRGLEVDELERLIATLNIPPRSPALHQLWRRLIVSEAAVPAGGESHARFEALRLEALYRSGLLKEIRETLDTRRSGPPDPLVSMLEARSEVGVGHREAGCDAVKRISDIRSDIPKPLRGEAILVSGFCAAATGNKAAAGLLAELAREEGIRSSPGLAALDAVALGVKTDISLAKGQKLSLIDYRILELAGASPPREELLKAAAPALLVAVAGDTAADPDLRLDAGEAAARINAYDPDALAALYRTIAGRMASGGTSTDTTSSATDSSRRRAAMYTSAQAERTPFKKVRLIRTFIDSARRAGLYLPGLAISAKLTEDVGLVPEIGWFAETAIEANLAAGNYENARKWAKFAASAGNDRGHSVDHWMALIDIADPHFPEPRGQSLTALERLALRGQFGNENLHRLATVLDALEYNVPIPLWEAASKTPQPTSGHLPETGVLSQLQDAAKKQEYGRTVLLAMQTLGPDGADGAHIIALGDSIRALKRAGLESDARRLGFEALLAGWPHVLTN